MSADWTVAAGTIALALITFCLAIATFFLWLSTRKLANDASESARDASDIARQAAQAARDSVNVAKESAEKQLRAYVGPATPRAFGVLGDERLRIDILVQNFGKTPAYDVQVLYDMFSKDDPEPTEQDFSARAMHLNLIHLGTIHPGEAGRASLSLRNTAGGLIDTAVATRIQAGTSAIYAHGEISYGIALDQERRVTRFRRFVKGPNILIAKEGGSLLAVMPAGETAT